MPSKDPIPIGVGFDTARYGHHTTFLRGDRQPAAKPLEFLESRSGYQHLDDVLCKLAQKHSPVHFYIRVDSAGQYSANLLNHLERLPWAHTISVGQPSCNKSYREVHFPKRKADATESHACARFAIVERPNALSPDSHDMLALREVASRLEFQVKQSTREVNRLHNLLARVFPELATLHNNMQSTWVLKLLEAFLALPDERAKQIVTIKGIEKQEAAGRKTGIIPQRKAVTATTSSVASGDRAVNGTPETATESMPGSVDFAYIRSQVTMEQVLQHLGYFQRLRGTGQQRRGPCPVHGSKRGKGRDFSVHLGKGVFQCFHPPCGAAGNVLDLWAAIHQLTT